jgi:hypothetical protein
MTLEEWIIYGETGISSKTMWAALKGVVKDPNDRWHFDVPHDRADFGRCYKLFTDCDLIEHNLKVVANTFPKWKPIVDNWKELCRRYDNNEPFYEYLQSLMKK